MTLPIGRRETAMADFAAAAMPLTFVLLWSSGYIAAKLVLPHCGTLTMVALRYLLAAAILVPIVILWRAPWPKSWTDVGHIAVTGILVNCVTLALGPLSMEWGAPAGLLALIQGMQPMLTALLAWPALGEKVNGRQWGGLALGLVGLVLVLSDKLGIHNASSPAIAVAFMSLVSMTVATLYQKRFCENVPLRSGAAIQFVVASVLMTPLAFAVEGMQADWTTDMMIGIAWLAFALSIGALTLFWILVRKGAAAKVASLFYLVPPITAVMGWLVFDERLGWTALTGMAVVTLGVLLATRQGTQPAA
jgi:drug/metabolite transporter (DMT)-like permease